MELVRTFSKSQAELCVPIVEAGEGDKREERELGSPGHLCAELRAYGVAGRSKLYLPGLERQLAFGSQQEALATSQKLP